MNFNQICDSIFRLYLYADLTKKIHYSTDLNHAHELCDEIRDEINGFVDEFAEQSFGYYGKPKFSDFRKLEDTDINETEDLAQLCERVEGIVSALRTDCEKVDKLSSIVSLIDDFKGKLLKLKFLCTFDKVSNYKSQK